MDQNPNDNLFMNNEPSKPPEEPFQPVQPEPPTISSGAQVYPPAPGFEPAGPQSYTPPPPPTGSQVYPPLPPVAQPPKSNRNIWIIVIVVLVLLCCCCLAIAAYVAWNNGDRWLEELSQILPLAQSFLV
jgi:hypothetical protein